MTRYDLVDESRWPWLSPALRGLDTDLASVETAVSAPLTDADMPAGFAMLTTGTTRPTSRADIPVIFTGADPGAAAFDGDLWVQPA